MLNLIGKGGGLLLDSGDVSLELTPDTLELADDGFLDRLGKSLVLLSEETIVVANLVEDFLPSSLTKETVTLVEGNLNGLVESEGGPARGVLDLSESLRKS